MNKDFENNDLEQLLDPKELAAAFEHTINFVKGDTEALPDVLQHSGRLLLKLSRRLSTTQMILLVGALTLGAIFVAKRVEGAMEEIFDEEDDNAGNRKALGSGSSGGKESSGNASANASGKQSAGSEKKATEAKASNGK